MARIRTIKPELFRHEDLFELESSTGLPIRTAFMGLFTVCDREGRFKWRPRRLKLDVLPYDDVDFSRVLDALATRDFIKMYDVNGETYGYIPSFTDHQLINNKEMPSSIPEPPNNLENPETTGVSTREPRVEHAYPDSLKSPQGEYGIGNREYGIWNRE